MIRPLIFASALWRSIKEAWADPNHYGLPDQEVDCPITDYTKAINCNPSNITAYLARGTAHFKAFAFDSAIADFTKVIELKANHDSAYTNKGSAYYKKGEFDRAIADFTRALEINPKSALAYCNLGWTYEGVGNEKKAIAHYRKALQLDPCLEEARDNLKLLGPSPEHELCWQKSRKIGKLPLQRLGDNAEGSPMGITT